MKWFKPDQHGILILDDLMEESGNEKRVLDLYTKDSHHRAITALYLTQDLFPPGKFAKTINRNAIMSFALNHRGTRLVFAIYLQTLTANQRF